MGSLRNKVVLITGASAGIGEGIAVHFAKLGSILSLTGRDKSRLDKVAQQCVDAGLSRENVLTIAGNLRDAEHRKQAIDKTVERFGKLNVLVNNAGVLYYDKTLTTTPEHYDEMMDVNLRTPIFLTQLAAPHLIKTKGNIVNISSIGGSRPIAELGPYCICKSGIDMFTQCLALEMAPSGVRVNAISPATIVSMIYRREHSVYQDEAEYAKFLEVQATRHPLGRVGYPSDVAQAAEYLASDAASFVSGQIIYVDGGRHCVSVGVSTQVKQ